MLTDVFGVKTKIKNFVKPRQTKAYNNKKARCKCHVKEI